MRGGYRKMHAIHHPHLVPKHYRSTPKSKMAFFNHFMTVKKGKKNVRERYLRRLKSFK